MKVGTALNNNQIMDNKKQVIVGNQANTVVHQSFKAQHIQNNNDIGNPYNQHMLQSAGNNLSNMMIDSNIINKNILNQKQTAQIINS